MELNLLFKPLAADAEAFLRLIQEKGEPSDPSKKGLYRFLEVQMMDVVRRIREGHHMHAAFSLVYLRGVAVGLGIASEKEIDQLQPKS
jgi:hypothetical protein